MTGLNEVQKHLLRTLKDVPGASANGAADSSSAATNAGAGAGGSGGKGAGDGGAGYVEVPAMSKQEEKDILELLEQSVGFRFLRPSLYPSICITKRLMVWRRCILCLEPCDRRHR